MCGISVIVALHGQNQNPKPLSTPENDYHQSPNEDIKAEEAKKRLAKELNDSLELIKHRGPDDRGQWINPDRRHWDIDGTVHAVVNGELYDYEVIRKDLEGKTDYRFKGRSDCEIVIALYKYYGLSFLSKLRGEFALCLYDSRTQFFVAARDRYGIKPLFWTIVDGRLLIAAEAKAFLALGWKPEWDVKSLLDAGWNHDERTLFLGVQKVRPGHYLTCQSFGHIETHKYWDVDYSNKRLLDARTEAEMIAGVRDLMLEAVRIRLRADVPVGIYLSGGLDSSAIAGMVTHLVKDQGAEVGDGKGTERVNCFSIAFDEDSGFDESSIANRTAEFLGVKYHKKHMNEAALAARYEDATWHCEHHNPDLNYVGKYALSEVPTELGFKVVLTGEGADENFGGYPTYLPDYLREPDQASLHNPLPEFKRLEQYEKTEEATRKYYEEVGADSTNRGESVARRMLNNITTITSMAAFFPPVFAKWTKCYGECDPRLTIANNVDGCARDCIMDKWHPLHSAQYVWTKGHLANIFLSCLGDRTEMAHSLEARTPFLDHKLTLYVNGLPPSVKIRWDQKEERFIEKWVLREASKSFITREVYDRKKHPYSAPTTYPADGPLHKLLAGLITESNISKLGFVDWGKVKGLVDKAFRHEDASAMRLAFTVSQWVVLSQRFGIRRAEDPVNCEKEAPNSVVEGQCLPQQMKESHSGDDMDRSGPAGKAKHDSDPYATDHSLEPKTQGNDQSANDEQTEDVHPHDNNSKPESANGESMIGLDLHRIGKPTDAAEATMQHLDGREEHCRNNSKVDTRAAMLKSLLDGTVRRQLRNSRKKGHNRHRIENGTEFRVPTGAVNEYVGNMQSPGRMNDEPSVAHTVTPAGPPSSTEQVRFASPKLPVNPNESCSNSKDRSENRDETSRKMFEKALRSKDLKPFIPLRRSLPLPRAMRLNSPESEQHPEGRETMVTQARESIVSGPRLKWDGEAVLPLGASVEWVMETQNRPRAPSSPTKRTRMLEPGDYLERQAQAKRVRIGEATEGTETEVNTETPDKRTASNPAYLGYMIEGQLAERMKSEHQEMMAEEEEQEMRPEYVNDGINLGNAAGEGRGKGKGKETETHISIEEVGEESREASDHEEHGRVKEVEQDDRQSRSDAIVSSEKMEWWAGSEEVEWELPLNSPG